MFYIQSVRHDFWLTELYICIHPDILNSLHWTEYRLYWNILIVDDTGAGTGGPPGPYTPPPPTFQKVPIHTPHWSRSLVGPTYRSGSQSRMVPPPSTFQIVPVPLVDETKLPWKWEQVGENTDLSWICTTGEFYLQKSSHILLSVVRP